VKTTSAVSIVANGNSFINNSSFIFTHNSVINDATRKGNATVENAINEETKCFSNFQPHPL
jgi:hypothetical protein